MFISTTHKICSTASTAAGLREAISNEEGVGVGGGKRRLQPFLNWLFFMQLICMMKQKDLETVTKIVHPLFVITSFTSCPRSSNSSVLTH